MLKSDTTKSLDVAFLNAKKNFKPLIRTKINPFFSKDNKVSKYADLSDVLEAVEGPLLDHGIIIYQTFGVADNLLCIWTGLVHAETSEFRAQVIQVTCPSDPQKTGSAQTYYRRYAVAAICGIAPDDDDDGNAAAEKPKNTPPAPAPKPKVNHTPAKPTNEPRPGEKNSNEPRTASQGPAEVVTSSGENRPRTTEEKTANNKKIRQLQSVSDADKLKQYVIDQLGDNYATATKAEWDVLIASLELAAANDTLKTLIGA
jgi:ERF superfamily